MRGLAHCPCCTPAVCAKGWRACGGGPVCKRGEDVAHPGRRGLPANREEGAWRTVSPAPWQARKGQGRRAGQVNVGGEGSRGVGGIIAARAGWVERGGRRRQEGAQMGGGNEGGSEWGSDEG